MGEDDILELLWKSGRVVPSSQTHTPSSDPPSILGGSGGGACEGNNAPLPQPPPPLHHHQSFFIKELHRPNRQDFNYSGVASTRATHPRNSASLAPPPYMAMRRMDMNRPPFVAFPGTPFHRPPHLAGVVPSCPAPRYPIDPSRAHLRSPQPKMVSDQSQFPAYMNPYSQFVGLHRPHCRGEDEIVELLWKNGKAVRSSQAQRPSPPPPPTILRGSGSGGGEENAPLPFPHLQPQPQPPATMQHHNLFIQEDEMASWLHHSYRQDYFCSELLYPGVASTSASHPQSSVSLAPSPSAPYNLPPERPTDQILAVRRAENLMNFSWLRRNIYTGSRVEVGQSIPVVGDLMQVGSSATPSSSASESSVIPATEGTESRVSRTFSVPGLGRKGKAVAIETARTPSSGVCKAETEPIPVQPATEAEIAEDTKRKENEKTIAGIQGTEEATGSTSRKRSRAAEMHNISERRRREKINEKMKALQELIPRCSKSDKASMLDDVIEYVKWLQSQIQMISMVQGAMPPMMYPGNMQHFMPNMGMGMMGMNRPPFIPFTGTHFPRPPHMAGLGPPYPPPSYPFPNIQTSVPSIVHLPTPQPNVVSNQPQFPAYINPYSQFLGLHQMQQPPPPFQSQTTSELNLSQASTSKELEDQDNQPTS